MFVTYKFKVDLPDRRTDAYLNALGDMVCEDREGYYNDPAMLAPDVVKADMAVWFVRKWWHEGCERVEIEQMVAEDSDIYEK